MTRTQPRGVVAGGAGCADTSVSKSDGDLTETCVGHVKPSGDSLLAVPLAGREVCSSLFAACSEGRRFVPKRAYQRIDRVPPAEASANVIVPSTTILLSTRAKPLSTPMRRWSRTTTASNTTTSPG